MHIGNAILACVASVFMGIPARSKHFSEMQKICFKRACGEVHRYAIIRRLSTAMLKSTPNGGAAVSRKYFDHDNFLIDSEISMKQKALI